MVDGIGVSGLIVGLPGLLVSCADLYKLTVKARKFDHAVEMVVVKAYVEQWRFAYWLQAVGFVPGAKPKLKLPRASQSIVLRLLEKVRDTLELLANMIEEYELPTNGPSAPDMTLPEPFSSFQLSSYSKQPLPSLPKRIAHSTTKPMKWAAAQQEKADKLLSDLRDLNDSLQFFSDEAKNSAGVLPSRMLPHVWGEGNLQKFIEATTEHEPELARCAELKRQVLAATASAATIGHRSGPRNRSPLELNPSSLSKRRRTESSRMDVSELKGNSTEQAEPVLIQDKSYEEGDAEHEKFVKTRVGEIAMILARSPKPARLRVLDCKGFVQLRSDSTFSLIFGFPEGFASDADPISLHKMLSLGPNGWDQRHRSKAEYTPRAKPSLRTRFAMAQSLCHTFSLLQACGVLHKGIAPWNIVFFKDQGGSNTPDFDRDLSRPYLTGFTWARLHGSSYRSESHPRSDSPYLGSDSPSKSEFLQAHPAYSFDVSQRYLKVFDLYSLGLVLLQIGLWRGLEDIADELFPSPKSSINTVGFELDGSLTNVKQDNWLTENIAQWQEDLVKRQRVVGQYDGIFMQANPCRQLQKAILQNLDTLLVHSMGETYTKVVARCLTGDIEADGYPKDTVERQSDESVPEYILQDAIVRNIIQELEKCSV